MTSVQQSDKLKCEIHSCKQLVWSLKKKSISLKKKKQERNEERTIQGLKGLKNTVTKYHGPQLS